MQLIYNTLRSNSGLSTAELSLYTFAEKAWQELSGLSWTHVSDLKGFDSSVAKQFFIHSIPDNFLIDPEGVIIARGLTGSELVQKLQSIFDHL